ncbi:S-adenosyl-L-methionine-dependent methyltransferase [Glomus cerebriforme]|uniref:S-adenosyl-L-methionine-dependent methyltransferase n=1 Tax=Glomus cerebriforme TaxID=658196 RepID=A0A397TDY6_9GLOM|nr:S-adenosyl-L-methionine-dependent methyltransferase [Glomus cerebriforme]
MTESFRDIINDEGEDGWDICWKKGLTPWDYGVPSPALKQLIEEKKFSLPKGRGLVPGCGKGYDVYYLSSDERHVTGIDISQTLIEQVKKEQKELAIPNPNVAFQQGNFFEFTPPVEKFQFIYDYTFLCALPPNLRSKWASRTAELISSGGILIALMFPIGDHSYGPPYALSPKIYQELLGKYFVREYFDENPISFERRKGKEYMSVWRRK